jgi:hypothetical protein
MKLKEHAKHRILLLVRQSAKATSPSEQFEVID